jgi:hypothetical protein
MPRLPKANLPDRSIEMVLEKALMSNRSEPRINGLAFERQHTKHAFMHTSEWIAVNKSLKSFDPNGEFAQSQ